MDALDYWRLCDELSVVQAALLIVDEDPSGTQDELGPGNRPKEGLFPGIDKCVFAPAHAFCHTRRVSAVYVDLRAGSSTKLTVGIAVAPLPDSCIER